MYFLLSNPPFIDICFTSTMVPEMRWTSGTEERHLLYWMPPSDVFFYVLCWNR
jgi:hypothetical protein